MIQKSDNLFEKHPKKTIAVFLTLFLLLMESLTFLTLRLVPREIEEPSYQIFDNYTAFQYMPNQKGYLKFINVKKPSYFETNKFGLVQTSDHPKIYKKTIVILGGSTVFGVGASSYKETIASHLQRLLNKKWPNTYRVLNGGVRGFFSYQEYVFYLNDVRKVNPDLVISFNGRNDGYLASKESLTDGFDTDYYIGNTGDYNRLTDSSRQAATTKALGKLTDGLIRGSYKILAQTHSGRLLAALKSFGAKTVEKKSEIIPIYNPSSKQVQKAAENYIYVMNLLAGALKDDGKEFLWVLQPTSTLYKTLSAEERKYLNPLPDYLRKTMDFKATLASFYHHVLKNASPLDLTKIFANTSRTLYTDDCHYNDEGNQVIARELAKYIFENSRAPGEN